ncbi:peptidyl-tRNA hydrolase [Candidatus Parvarchaeota archaeon]|nr:peptidyl-tRNA hydrolase [Candidatus Parvarchaeota archaeon]
MELKQVIVVRNDLGMGKGKLAGQVGHAAVLGYIKVLSKDKKTAKAWEDAGQKKIVVKVENEAEFFGLYEKMKRAVPCALVQDAGMTQLAPGTATCFAAGPWNAQEIDKFTGELKLL